MEVKNESFLKHGKQRRLDRRHLPRGGVDPMELILSVYKHQNTSAALYILVSKPDSYIMHWPKFNYLSNLINK